MKQKFDNLPLPNDSFSAPYGYFENLPERTIRRLHDGNRTDRLLSPLWRFRWSGSALLFVLAVIILSRLNHWNIVEKEKAQVASLEVELFGLPESARIEYLLASHPSPDPHWMTTTELGNTPIIESEIATEELERYATVSLPIDYEWLLMSETELTDLP